MAAVVAGGDAAGHAGGAPLSLNVPPWAAFGLVAAGLALLGGRAPTLVYGSLVLILLYLLLTHTRAVGELINDVVGGLGAPLEEA